MSLLHLNAAGMAGCLALGLQTAATASTFDSRLEIVGYGQTTDIWKTSPFTRVAQPPEDILATELRPDLVLRQGALAASLKPRLALTQSGEMAHASRWLSEGWLRWQPAPGWSLQGGREALLWGPSMFWNPSNPLFPVSNKANPQREVTGKNLLRLRWQATPAWALTWIGEIGRSETDSGPRHLAAVKLDWAGEAAAAAFIAATEPGHTPSWQGYAQWTASDAMLLYGELAWKAGSTYSLAESAPHAPGWVPISRSSPRRASGLIGASYTFMNNWTAYAELWHNGNGLSAGEAAHLGNAATFWAAEESARHLADLGSLLNQPSPLRRNYAGLQLGSDSSGRTSARLRLIHSFDDQGNEWVAILNHNFSDHLQGWLNLMRRTGPRTSEYGRWVRGNSMLGLTWFIW